MRRAVGWGKAVWAVGTSLALVGCANAPYPAEIERNDTLVLAYGDPTTLDPTVSYIVGEAAIVSLINPSFYRYKFLKRNPYTLELNLGAAEPTRRETSYADIGDDGKPKVGMGERWTYRIRHDLRFQDDPCFPGGKGRPLTAADFVYAFKRMADPTNHCPVSAYFADKVVGWNAYAKGFTTLKGKQYDREMPGVKVDPQNPYAFTITLNQPYPQLKFLMAMAFTAPQAREAVERYGDQYALHHPVGCGPFMLKEYKPHDHLWLVRNPNAPKESYPGEADPNLQPLLRDAGKRLPFLQNIYLPILSEPVTSYNLFQQGYLDALGVGGGNAQIVPAANGLTADMKAKGVTLNKNVGIDIGYLAFNMEDPTFGGYTPEKRKLRQAISLAIDAGAYIDVIQQGMGVPAQWVVPPGLPEYDPTYRNPYRQFDPKLTRAKKLLSEAGYPNGVDPKTGERLVLHYDNYATSASLRQIVRLYQKQIQALGIQVELNSVQGATFNDRISKRQAQFFDYAWSADYPDAENFTFLLYGPNAAPGPNSCLYNNPEYNRLFERMRAMKYGPERKEIVARMRDIAVEDCPWIYVQHSESRTLVQPWVRNLSPNPLANDGMKYIAINSQRRLQAQAAWNRPSYWPLAALIGLGAGIYFPASATIRQRVNRRLRQSEEVS